MNKNIRLLVESFFDDDIFDVGNDIKQDIEDLGKYYDYQVGDIYYLNDKPYAVCCGEPKYFKDDKPRFCLLNNADNRLKWRTQNILVEELECFDSKYFVLDSINDFKHIDEDGYGNTQIIKNNYDIIEFPAFEYCINLGKNVYLPAIDELQIMLLNKDKLKGVIVLGNNMYWTSTQNNFYNVCCINIKYDFVGHKLKYDDLRVCPFFRLD